MRRRRDRSCGDVVIGGMSGVSVDNGMNIAVVNSAGAVRSGVVEVLIDFVIVVLATIV